MDESLVGRIRLAMSSPKFEEGMVTSSLRHDFEDLLEAQPDVDLTKLAVPLVIQTSNPGKLFSGQLGCIANFHAVLLPYERLPEIVEDQDVLQISYSTSRFVTDE